MLKLFSYPTRTLHTKLHPLGDPMLLLDRNILTPAVMYVCHMDRAVAEGSRSVFMAHLRLLGDSKPTTHEPRQGQVPGQRHVIAHGGPRVGWQRGPNPTAW